MARAIPSGDSRGATGRSMHSLSAAAAEPRTVMRLLCFLIAGALVAGAPAAFAQQSAPDRPVRHEVWDIPLGAAIADLPDDFVDYACGTNGGPPSTPLSGWKDYRRCRPDADGLREVYFRYDDEIEYWAKANSLTDQMEQYIGTKTYGFPVTVSVLIGDGPEAGQGGTQGGGGMGGIVRGIRIVSDPRDPTGDRDEAYLLRNFLNARFGRDGWQCEDLGPDPGETPVAGIFVKQRCDKDMDGGVHGRLLTRHLRKPGQSQYDPHSGRETTNQFESSVRFELVKTR
ncbi:MAG: hypothetical protein J2P53_07850 [Bradyrhizobiaceae bacterium]|nr:hypothetical protein [Bradyrhizobiaceae bacterium]